MEVVELTQDLKVATEVFGAFKLKTEVVELTQAMKVVTELCETENDSGWKIIFGKLLERDFPLGVNVAKVFITCSRDGKSKRMKLKTSDEDTRETLKKFLQSCGMFSSSGYEEELRKYNSESENRWSKLRRGTVKNHLLQIFAGKLSELCDDSVTKDSILTLIISRILTKSITTTSVVADMSGYVDRIDGLLLENSKMVYGEKGWCYSLEYSCNIEFQSEEEFEN